MSQSLRFLLILLAVLTASTETHAAGKAARRPAHRAVKTSRHVSHSKTNRYRRPAVHRKPVQHARRRTTHVVRRPVKRTVVHTVRRYPVHRVYRRTVRRPYYAGRVHRYHRRYTYLYYPGRYHWRTNYYNRAYSRSRRYSTRSIRGIVEGVRGNANNGTVLVKVARPRSSRFRYTTNAAFQRTNSLHRFHVNNGTRYEIRTTPPRAASFASLHKGEQVLILKHASQANTARTIEVFPRRLR